MSSFLHSQNQKYSAPLLVEFKLEKYFYVTMTGFLCLCSSFLRAKFPQEVYCTIEFWGDTHKSSVCLKSINLLLNH